jgi:hypothetical protein
MLFKIQHWPGANIAILAGLVTGTFLFVPSLLFQLFRDEEKKHKRALYVIGALSIVIYAAGFWFRILHWPLASIFLFLGAFVLFFIVLPLFTRMQWKNETNVNARFIFMIIAPLLFVLPGALVNLSLERTYENGFFIRLQKQDALVKLQENENTRFIAQYHDSVAYGNIEGIHSATTELLGVINLVEQNLSLVAENNLKDYDPDLIELKGLVYFDPSSNRFPKNTFSIRPASQMLLPGNKVRVTLEKEIEKFKQVLIQKLGTEWIKMYDPLLNVSEFMPGKETSITNYPLIVSLNSLSLLKNGVLVTESAALKQIADSK